jgi:hypothetical protein
MNKAVSRAAFSGTIAEFQALSNEELVGSLTSSSEFDVVLQQRDAWIESIRLLRDALTGVRGFVALEYIVPRIGSRVDAIVIVGAAVFVIEFKIGQSGQQRGDLLQVWDYALDLKYFHAASHSAKIIPVLVPSLLCAETFQVDQPHPDGCYPPVTVSPRYLGALIGSLASIEGEPIDSIGWFNSHYLPTPTIIEAARRLYSEHSVAEITRSDAGAPNLHVTLSTIESVISESLAKQQKSVVFVTGVPGAGKTLVGLDVATRKRKVEDKTHAVYLSGNGPLVAVLRESLVRDECARRKQRGEPRSKHSKASVSHEVKAFIQNVHHFRDEGLRSSGAPNEHVVIFDEAQRAWTKEKTASFMARRKGVQGFERSEPDFLLSCADRHPDWTVVVCLVGSGQEINDGEAGISEWLRAVVERYPAWQVHVSPELGATDQEAASLIAQLDRRGTIEITPGLHLSASMRSFRAEQFSSFVQCLLERDAAAARRTIEPLRDRYPVFVTRDLSAAKQWLRRQARGSESYGMVASSKAQRLKPHAIDVRVDVNPIHWFLGAGSDTRSSYFLEDAATEFQVQGLELDWVCVNWDADLRMASGEWSHHFFRGKKWQKVVKQENQRYLLNAYRVLLTRARQGLVIFVPWGSTEDHTRRPSYYDETYEFLCRSGAVPLG